MNDPQGIVNFGGVTACLRFQHTMINGISPSVATMTTAPQDKLPVKYSDLVFQYGPRSFRLKNCLLDSIQVTTDDKGQTLWQWRIFDRRWLWREVEWISGYYNTREGGEKDGIVKDTEKTPRELAKLCLEAMGETGYRVDEMPDDTRPLIEWDYENPAEALARLCDQLGCVVSLGLDDRVRIHVRGVGAPLPAGGLTGDVEVDPPDPPGEIVIVGDYVRHQVDIFLEPVGLDVDNKIKPINELSYAPIIGGYKNWEEADVHHFNDDYRGTPLEGRKARDLARRTVFRWYRIRSNSSDPRNKHLRLPGQAADGETLFFTSELWRILPLYNEQCQTEEIDSIKRPLPPWVYGKFWNGDESAETAERAAAGASKYRYMQGFSLDVERGIVQFNEPVYRFQDPEENDHRIIPAELWLRVAVSVRDKTTRGFFRTEFGRAPKRGKPKGKLRTAKKPVRHDDLRLMYWRDDEHAGDATDNRKEIEKQANYYLAAEEQKYQLQASGSVDYAGFLPINCDGAIQQVTSSIGTDGFAMTRISRNKEESLIVLPYKERRMYEQLLAAQAKGESPSRTKE